MPFIGRKLRRDLYPNAKRELRAHVSNRRLYVRMDPFRISCPIARERPSVYMKFRV
jgi:hypothetical protein